MPKAGESSKPGLGTSIVEALARQLGANTFVTNGGPGTHIALEHLDIVDSRRLGSLWPADSVCTGIAPRRHRRQLPPYCPSNSMSTRPRTGRTRGPRTSLIPYLVKRMERLDMDWCEPPNEANPAPN